MEMDLSFFFFILRFLQDTVAEEWMILEIEKQAERRKPMEKKEHCFVAVSAKTL